MWNNHTNLTLVTPPSQEVVSVDDVKAQGRILVDDSVIAGFLVVARKMVEAMSRRQLITATYEFCLDRFPWQIIRLPVPPIQSVTSIQYLDTAGNLQTLDPSYYVTDLRSNPARIMPQFGKIYPPTRPIVNAITVQFVAGYGDNPTDVPETYRQAILMLATHLYENREATTTLSLEEVPLGVKNLIAAEGWGEYY